VKGDMCRIRTLDKIPPWVKVLDHKGKIVARIAFKECFEGLVNSNMKPTLGQICKDETCNVTKYDTPSMWIFMSSEKLSSVVFHI
jgi:hypothetical protein